MKAYWRMDNTNDLVNTIPLTTTAGFVAGKHGNATAVGVFQGAYTAEYPISRSAFSASGFTNSLCNGTYYFQYAGSGDIGSVYFNGTMFMWFYVPAAQWYMSDPVSTGSTLYLNVVGDSTHPDVGGWLANEIGGSPGTVVLAPPIMLLWPQQGSAMSAWIKTSVAGSSVGSAWVFTIKEWEPTPYNFWIPRFQVGLDNTSPPTAMFSNGDTQQLRAVLPTVDVGVFNHLLALWTQDTVSIYWNGVLVGTAPGLSLQQNPFWGEKYYLEIAPHSSVIDEVAYWTNFNIPSGTNWNNLAAELWNGGTGVFYNGSTWAP
jgi:hypothetical protein